MFSCKMVKSSVGPAGIPLHTLAVTYPRFVHAEVMTHRDKARNAASSRAIPWKKKKKNSEEYVENCMFQMVMSDPVIPEYLGIEKEGMQAGEELQGEDRRKAIEIILKIRDQCVSGVEELAALGLHKSICNRYVEPFMWITVLISGTEWKNFFRLRCHSAAERHFQHIAGMMRDEIRNAKPMELKEGGWHLPYFEFADAIELARRGFSDPFMAPKVSAGRSARLSYLTHEGIRDIGKDIKLADQLIDPPTAGLDENVMHASPLEHPSQAMTDPTYRSGPYRGWKQFRKFFPRENVVG